MTPERQNKLKNAIANRQFNFSVILENVFDPHNVSAVMRSCDSVGIQEIYVLTTNERRYKRWGYRSSSGAYKWMTVYEFTNTEECIKEVRKRYDKILTAHLDTNAVSLYSLDFTTNIALVFGNEQEGITPEMLALTDGSFIIPQVGVSESLNISVACAVSLYEAFRQRQEKGFYNVENWKEPQKMELYNKWINKYGDHPFEK